MQDVFIGEALQSNSKLTELYLGIAIKLAYYNCSIDANNIGATGCQYIGDALKLNSALTYLDLGIAITSIYNNSSIENNNIGDMGVAVIIKSISLNPSSKLSKLILPKKGISTATMSTATMMCTKIEITFS